MSQPRAPEGGAPDFLHWRFLIMSTSTLEDEIREFVLATVIDEMNILIEP